MEWRQNYEEHVSQRIYRYIGIGNIRSGLKSHLIITAKIEQNVSFVTDCGMLEPKQNCFVAVLTYMKQIMDISAFGYALAYWLGLKLVENVFYRYQISKCLKWYPISFLYKVYKNWAISKALKIEFCAGYAKVNFKTCPNYIFSISYLLTTVCLCFTLRLNTKNNI